MYEPDWKYIYYKLDELLKNLENKIENYIEPGGSNAMFMFIDVNRQLHLKSDDTVKRFIKYFVEAGTFNGRNYKEYVSKKAISDFAKFKGKSLNNYIDFCKEQIEGYETKQKEIKTNIIKLTKEYHKIYKKVINEDTKTSNVIEYLAIKEFNKENNKIAYLGKLTAMYNKAINLFENMKEFNKESTKIVAVETVNNK